MAQQQADDPLIQKTIAGIDAKVPPAMQNAYQRIVTAGLKVMSSPKTNHLLNDELDGADPAVAAGQAAVKLLGLLYRQSKGSMPVQPAMLAATTLLMYMLDYLEKAGALTIDQAVIERASKTFMQEVLKAKGVRSGDLQQMINQNASKMPPFKGGGSGAPAAPAPPPAEAAPPAPGGGAGIIGGAM
jgi:hypothetical protein